MGHHGGLDTLAGLRALLRSPQAPEDAETVERFYAELPEARAIAESPRSLVPPAWLADRLVGELGLRLTFSALVDADCPGHRGGHSECSGNSRRRSPCTRRLGARTGSGHDRGGWWWCSRYAMGPLAPRSYAVPVDRTVEHFRG
ncbi:MAG TPA: hypothetical protein VFX16_28815 [Pseudonocardiaceae bacterium]|nr:hypothetical protein [Pseudonocardiaceae bacterium]